MNPLENQTTFTCAAKNKVAFMKLITHYAFLQFLKHQLCDGPPGPLIVSGLGTI